MNQAKSGDTVKVHYTGRLTDTTVFDSSREREPLTFTIGTGQIILGFEKAVIGMQPGDAKTTHIPADEAYGPHQGELLLEIERGQFPPDIEPQVGMQLQLQQPDGQAAVVTIAGVSNSTVILDANHPLAGQDLTFDIELVEIV